MEEGALIVGSGPAGLSAALYLSAHGMRVTVVERLSDSGYPVYHSVCGAGISDAAFRDLEMISPSDICNRITSTELVFPEDLRISMKVNGYVLDRVAFLRHLRERCMENGAEFVRTEVTSVERSSSGFVTHTRSGDLGFKYILGCDGAHSVVRRDLFGSKPQMMAVDEFIVDEPADEVFRIVIAERYHGLYEWSFPAGGKKSIGSGKGILHPENVISKGARHIPFGGVPRISDSNAYICGDAAGMANPVSGGGLRVAMVSAQNAAREILGGKPGSYQRWWDRSILSSPRFMGFRETLMKWDDAELVRASRMFRNGRNVYVWGVIAGILHPKYVPMYIGCLKTFNHTW